MTTKSRLKLFSYFTIGIIAKEILGILAKTLQRNLIYKNLRKFFLAMSN